ncbi:carboxypeptidase regulatory-like domain-containing protein [Longispora sp. K20-0274]|uniref:carboxypeptidase regulatory-like domain-containing protein n=1 Tax=Longispora sp. K20-0274 TaxID=3088255 RepID=UPI003999A78F
MSVSIVRKLLVVAAISAVAIGLAGPARAADPSTIQGTITDVETGAPVSGAWVQAQYPSGGTVASAQTDSLGHYDLPLDPGSYAIQVTHGDYAEQWAFDKPDRYSADVITAPGTASLALRKLKYGSISGTFMRASGAPVPAGVALYDLNQNERDRVQVDAGGAFRFDHRLVGQYKLRFFWDGPEQWSSGKHGFYEADPVTVAADQTTVVHEVAFPVGTIVFTVVDAVTKKPVAGASVSTQEGPQQVYGFTDANGKATVTGAATGTYSFRAGKYPDYVDSLISGVVVRDGATTQATLAINPGAVILVKVRDANTGAPVDRACVYVLDERSANALGYNSTCGGADGDIRINPFPPGKWKIYVRFYDGGYGSQWVGRSGGTGDPDEAAWFSTAYGRTTEVTVKADAAGSVGGVVTDAVTGAPVQGLCTSATPVYAQATESPYGSNCTDATGHYTINNLGPYRWKVLFPDRAGKYAWVWSGGEANRRDASSVRVRSGQTAAVDAKLALAGKVTGTFTGYNGPWYYMTVSAVNSETGEYMAPFAQVTEDNTYTLSGLASQRIRITYAGNSGGTELRYPSLVRVRTGQTTTGINLVVPA